MTLRDAMDRLFDDAFTRPLSLVRSGGSTWSALPIDMYQTDDDAVVKAVVPGLRPDQVQISVTGDVLNLRGEVKQEEDKKDRAWHIREHRWGSFERSVALPVPVVSDKASAEFENGILTITLPRAEEVRPRTISIKAAIELSAAAVQIRPGESTALSIAVGDAEETVLWQSPARPESPEPLNWPEIRRLGEEVRQPAEVRIAPEQTTAWYLVATGRTGMSGRRIVIEVVRDDAEPSDRPQIWSPETAALNRMEDPGHLAWPCSLEVRQPAVVTDIAALLRLAQKWSASPNPSISLSAGMDVMFDDESCTLSWNISNAGCAEMGMTLNKTTLVADTGKISGTKAAGGGWGAAGMPPCSLALNGSWTLSGQQPYGGGHRTYWFTAHNVAGQSTTFSQWVDILSIPQFKGAVTPSRTGGIRNALKTIDRKLRNGCIFYDAALDTQVAAFKDGHLNRTELWARLLAELENIKLDTFTCKDVADKDWGAGHWWDYTNEIILEWSPTHAPNLGYVILHELVHKCGFNGGLLKFYSHMQIEDQAFAIADACFP